MLWPPHRRTQGFAHRYRSGAPYGSRSRPFRLKIGNRSSGFNSHSDRSCGIHDMQRQEPGRAVRMTREITFTASRPSRTSRGYSVSDHWRCDCTA